MLITLILSILAGVFYPRARPWVAEMLGKILPRAPDAARLEVATFGACLLAVAALKVLTGLGGNAFVVIAGGLIGAFHAPLREMWETRRRD